MREFKESIYRILFIKYGTLIDKETPNWSRHQLRMIDRTADPLDSEDRRYRWFYQTFLILYKLKLSWLKEVTRFSIHDLKQVTSTTAADISLKEGFDIISSLIIQIENASLIERIQEHS